MAVYVSNIVIEQGFDFDTSFQLEDTRTNAPLILSDASTTAQMRKIMEHLHQYPLHLQLLTA